MLRLWAYECVEGLRSRPVLILRSGLDVLLLLTMLTAAGDGDKLMFGRAEDDDEVRALPRVTTGGSRAGEETEGTSIADCPTAGLAWASGGGTATRNKTGRGQQ